MADNENSVYFIDDVVINYDDAKNPKLLTRDALEKLPDIGNDLTPVVDNLLASGVVVAAIPSNPGIGASCYLLNLTAIRKPDSE